MCVTPYHTYHLIDACTFMHNGGRVLSCHAYLLIISRHILDASQRPLYIGTPSMYCTLESILIIILIILRSISVLVFEPLDLERILP